MNFVLSVLVAAAAGVTAPAAGHSATASPQEEPKQVKEAEKICRLVALNPDSRRKERLCLTSAEWRELNNPR